MKFVLSTFGTPTAELPLLAPVAEDCGWGAISLSDHVVHPERISTPYPYTEDGTRRWEAFTEWPDPMVMLGALAAVTQRIELTNNLFVLPIRNPFLVAKAVATAAVLSGNRVILTIGIGWSRDEFALMQQDFHNRGRRADEMLEILRLLWRGEMVEFRGEYYQFDRLEMNPAPSLPVPVMVGGISTAALRRAARLADGWLSDWQSAEAIVHSIGRLRRYRAEFGREGAPLVMASPNDVYGADAYRLLEEQGVTHLLMQPWDVYFPEGSTLEQKKESLRRFAEDVIEPCNH